MLIWWCIIKKSSLSPLYFLQFSRTCSKFSLHLQTSHLSVFTLLIRNHVLSLVCPNHSLAYLISSLLFLQLIVLNLISFWILLYFPNLLSVIIYILIFIREISILSLWFNAFSLICQLVCAGIQQNRTSIHNFSKFSSAV